VLTINRIGKWFPGISRSLVQEVNAPPQCIGPNAVAHFRQTERLFNTLINDVFFHSALRKNRLKPARHFATFESSRTAFGASREGGQAAHGFVIPIHARPTGRAILTGPCNGARASR
jgi:hypothetical protein